MEQNNNYQVSRETVIETDTHKEGISNTINEDEENFFNKITRLRENKSHRSLKSKAQNLRTSLEAVLKEVLIEVAFMREQVLIDLFMNYNSAIPLSAVTENLFSRGKNILESKRVNQSDNFEKLTFMKGNQHHTKAIKKAQPE